MIAYYGTRISPHMTETLEGFLICHDVPINRIGEQEYTARELQLGGEPDRVVIVHRYPEDVFEDAALASFEGKDVTAGHPPENVGPENYAAYSKGHVENVRRRGDMTIADLHIKDAGLISDIKNGIVREVSCGYLCQYEPDGTGYKQIKIRGNHVAIVPRGRAGSTVSIKDAAQEAEKGRSTMSKFSEAVLSAFGMAAKEANRDELQQLVATTATALDAAPAEQAPEAEPAKAEANKEETEHEEAAKDVEAQPQQTLDAKLDRLIEMISALMQSESKPEPMSDEKVLDKVIAELSGREDPEAAVTVPAEQEQGGCMEDSVRDAAVLLLKKVRPAVAAIENRKERARVTDALLSAIKGPNVMGDIMAATRHSAQRAQDASSRTNYEKVCADQKAEYDARNPHKAKKEV